MAGHGGLTAPALVLVCGRLLAKKTMFAMHERTLPGAAGVSPPWFGKRACNGEMTIFSVDHR
jgi:hypothetical protein